MRAPVPALAALAACLLLAAGVARAQTAPDAPAAVPAAPMYPALPSETPAEFVAPTGSFDYVRRTVMIPMRDGVKLNTVILLPRGAAHAPMLLTRTPYGAVEMTSHAESSQMASILAGYDNATDVIVDGGYIRVVQDVRGKYGSEGDYVMNRPLHGPLNPTPVDHSTDTWDTIEWLTKNVPESNGKVGILGISYDGFLPLMALVHPHPALKVAVPMNPMVDGWRGDDWFHNGAFRQINLSYVMEQVVTRRNDAKWFTSHYDDYDMYLNAVSAGQLARERGLEQSGFWRKLSSHPAYDAFWREQAMDRILANEPVTVPTMLVHSLWDAEDIYGAIAVYKAIKPKDVDNNKVFLVLGPWNHGGEIGDGSRLGALKFNSDTGLHFREEILRPFLDRYLKDDDAQASSGANASSNAHASSNPNASPGALPVPPVSAFETGTNKWRKLNGWPLACASGCTNAPVALHLAPQQKLSFTAPAKAGGAAAYDEYVSDPNKPVPFRARPIAPYGYDETKGQTWPRWLADDQREASGRTDVLTYTTEVLKAPVKIGGEPVAHLMASTSGSDADWVVKLIDLYPDQVAAQPEMGGFQLMVSADILRGRYREGFEVAKPIAADKVLGYRFALPTANHVFLPGHRIMVQIQSSWFPLYDRNPQTFVPNIFFAKKDDYKKATQRVYHSAAQDSYIELPLVGAPPF